MKKDLLEIHPSVLFDLKKYHSSAFEVFEKHRDTHFVETVAQNLVRGIKEGVYRPEIDIQVMSRLRVLEIESMFDRNLFPESEWNITNLQLHFVDHFVRGVVTPKGLKEWENISKNLFLEIR
jgi:hypothetical protein